MCFVDFSCREIKIGDYFVYAALLGRSAVLKYGKVVDLVTKKERYTDEHYAYISAITVEWSGWQSSFVLQKKGSPIALNFPERLCIIPSEIIPEQARNLLDQGNTNNA